MPSTESLPTEASAPAESAELTHAVQGDSAAAGDFIPIALDQIFMKAMAGLPVYLERDQGGIKRYNMHCGESARFSDFHRRRLQERGIRYVFVPKACHLQYRVHVEKELESIAIDTALPPVARAGLIYAMGLDLLREWMSGEAGNRLARLDSVARAACAFVASEPKAFCHFFSCAQRDDRIATHMANVGLWMTALAFSTGTTDRKKLKDVCLAGLLLDTGIRTLSQKMLLKPEDLTADERTLLRSHPAHGADYLKSNGVKNEAVLRVAIEHHERLDGSGYPAGLKGEQTHPLSQLAAVIDSFEAMTSPRPYKPRVKTIAEAIAALQGDSAQYHQPHVEGWVALLKQAAEQGVIRESVDGKGEQKTTGRRQHQRFGVDCPMQIRVLTASAGSWVEGPALAGKVRNISKTGVGVQLKEPINPGTYIRLNTKGKGTLQDRTFEGQVMRCQPCKDGHEIGIRVCVPGK